MIVYLDQNKWIELARIVNGKDKSQPSTETLKRINAAVNAGVIMPLSAIHYLEFASISNDDLRARLGKVMWKYSQGFTIASNSHIVRREIELGINTIFPEVSVRDLNLIGKGVGHAFGQEYGDDFPTGFEALFEKWLLTGAKELGVAPAKLPQAREKFQFLSHLESLQKNKANLPRGKWDDWLYAVSLVDVLEVLSEVCREHEIAKERFIGLGKADYYKIVEAMPTRRLDVHLHRQVIKNGQYKPKPGDMEDWAGVGVASCYCDIVICERHLADLLRRDKYQSFARIETSLHEAFKNILL